MEWLFLGGVILLIVAQLALVGWVMSKLKGGEPPMGRLNRQDVEDDFRRHQF